MKHFTKNDFLSNDKFVHVYSGISRDELGKEIDKILVFSGYSLSEGIMGNGTYIKGNRVLRILFGAFVKYFKFYIGIEPVNQDSVKATITKTTSGMSGGLIGMSQVKKELQRLAILLQSI
jgi:hypothetical protein